MLIGDLYLANPPGGGGGAPATISLAYDYA